MLISAGGGRVSASQSDKREVAKREAAKNNKYKEKNPEVISESVRKFSLLDESYYNPKILNTSKRAAHNILLDDNGKVSRKSDYSLPTTEAQSDINLEFGLRDPNGDLIEVGQRYDAGFQKMVMKNLPVTGYYDLEVYNDRWDASESTRDTAVAWSTGDHILP